MAQTGESCGRAAKVYEKGGGLEDLSGTRRAVLAKVSRGFDTMADGFEQLHREVVALPEPGEKAGAARKLEAAFAVLAAHHREASDLAAAGDVDGLKATLDSEIPVKEQMAAATDALGIDC